MAEEDFEEMGDELARKIMETLSEYLEDEDGAEFALVVFRDHEPTDACFFSSTEDRSKSIKAMREIIFAIEEPENTTKH